MPRKPKKPCNYPGCPKLTDGLYCEEHKTIVNQQYEKYGRKYKRSDRYGSAWQKVRKRYVKLHPFCEECFSKGILTPVEHVSTTSNRLTKAARMTLTTSRACVSHVIHGYTPSEVTTGIIDIMHNKKPQGRSKSTKNICKKNGCPSRVYKSEFKRGIAPRQG